MHSLRILVAYAHFEICSPPNDRHYYTIFFALVSDVFTISQKLGPVLSTLLPPVIWLRRLLFHFVAPYFFFLLLSIALSYILLSAPDIPLLTQSIMHHVTDSAQPPWLSQGSNAFHRPTSGLF